MAKLIESKDGLITNAALEQFAFLTSWPELKEHNGERFRVIYATWQEEGSNQPAKYMIRFHSGEFAEVDFCEISRLQAGGYPQWGGEPLTVDEAEDKTGNWFVSIKRGDLTLASMKFPPGEDVWYVASPLSAATPYGMTRNMTVARTYEMQVSQSLKCPAIAPHAWLPCIIDDTEPHQRKVALDFGLRCLARCKGVAVFAGNGISDGMRGEIKRAMELGLELYYKCERGNPSALALADAKAYSPNN